VKVNATRCVQWDGVSGRLWLAVDAGGDWNGFAAALVTPAVRDAMASECESRPDAMVNGWADAAADLRALEARPDGLIDLRGFALVWEPCECGAVGVHPYPIGGGWALACDGCRAGSERDAGDGASRETWEQWRRDAAGLIADYSEGACASAAWALGHVGPEAAPAAPALRALANDADELAREEAREALDRIGGAS
jgi:hypothetical protein